MKYFCILLFIAVTCPRAVIAQTTLGSLDTTLALAKTHGTKANAYFGVAHYYLNKNVDSCIYASRQSIYEARKAHDKKGVAKAFVIQGKALTKSGNDNEGVRCYFTALQICEKEHFAALTAKIYNNLGIIYAEKEEDTTAISYYTKALAIHQDSNDADLTPAFQLMTNIAETYMQMGLPDSAGIYNKKGLFLAQAAKDTQAIAILLYNIGDNYAAEKSYGLALPYIDSAMRLSEKINDAEGVAYCNNKLGVIYYGLGRYKKSISYSNKALAMSNSLGIRPKILAYQTRYLNYFALKMYQEALTCRNLGKKLEDSLNSLEKNKQLRQIQEDYAIETKQQEINLLVKENELTAIKQKIAFFTALATGLLLFSGLLSYARIRRLKGLLQRRNKEMHVKNNLLAEISETKNKLISIVAHDFKGPIGSFKNMLQLEKTNKVPAEERVLFFQKLYDGFAGTLELLEALLVWAETQAGIINPRAEPFDIWQAVHQNVLLLQMRAGDKNITVKTAGTPGALYVEADVYMTGIAVRNLLDNAIKFSNPRGAVTILAEKEDGFIKVSITDHGTGISTANQRRLFAKTGFRPTSGTAGEKGSGLGLQITKELLEKNGGKIWFESKAGQGSTFYFTLPAADNAGGSANDHLP